jgi:hypothetical protein
MRRLLLPLALVLAALLAPAAGAAEQLLTVQLTEPRAQLALLERLGIDVTHHVTRYSADVITRSEGEKALLRRYGFRYVVEEDDLAAQARTARRAERAWAAQVQRSALPSGRETYRQYADYLREMDALVAAHPNLVRKVTLPKQTVMGEPIVGVEIADGVHRTDDGRPVYVVMGLHHAREWPSAEVNMEFALDLARGFGNDSRITALLERERVVVIPIVNPDGFKVSRANATADAPFRGTANAGSNKRKNCAINTPAEENQPCRNRSGVDLNRNYGAYWGGNGASTFFVLDDYRGPAPWSEPETQAVHEYTQRLQVTNLQTIHNIAALVLRPPGFRALGRAPDEPRLKALGDDMGAATGYESQYGWELYEVTGATEDWNYVAQGAFGYTIELGGRSGFQGPYNTNVVDQYVGAGDLKGKGVREALLLAAEQAANPADHAIIRGRAPAGRVLRVRKDFKTTTSPVCPVDVGTVDSITGQISTDLNGPYIASCPPEQTRRPQLIDDFLETTTAVPASGEFTWHVNPSTRPFERKEGRREAWTFTCETPQGVVLERHQVFVWRGETASFPNLKCDATSAVAPSPAPTVSRTPPDPVFAAFERKLGAAARKPPRRALLRVGRILGTDTRLLRRRRTLRVKILVRGTTLRNVRGVLRNADRQIIARGFLRRVRRRATMTVRLPRGLRPGRYRFAVRAIASNGATMTNSARVLVVRRAKK